MASVYALLKTLLLLYMLRDACLAAEDNTLRPGKPLKDPRSLVSANGIFRLGFFSPDPGSGHRYLGIWYNKVPKMTVVWVANRKNPIKGSSGVLKISDNGNLQLLSGRSSDIIWSSNLNLSDSNMHLLSLNSSYAQLLDSGNLVLSHSDYSSSTDQPASLSPRPVNVTVWESFDHPTDTFLAGMTLSSSTAADKIKIVLRSWRTPLDPSEGCFGFSLGTTDVPTVYTWNYNTAFWRSGPYNGILYMGDHYDAESSPDIGFSVKYNPKTGAMDNTYSLQNASLMFNIVLEFNGSLTFRYWNQMSQEWGVVWSGPSAGCDHYGMCGPFGSCNMQSSPICKCLRGFQPKNEAEWNKGNWSGGCVRRTQLQCVGKEKQDDEFLRLPWMKPPDNIEKQSAVDQDGCRRNCLKNCSCIAYSYLANIGCMTWTKDLIDTTQYPIHLGVDLFLRLASSELAEEAHKKSKIIASVVVIGGLASIMFICCIWRCIRKRGKRGKIQNEPTFRNNNVAQAEFQQPQLFTYQTLKKATNNFQDTNKLGQGGSATVYKGTLEDGKEIAVKKLFQGSDSEQGEAEFMNEVAVMSELQHRNLVRLLGCCVTRDEKMLVYEYMPNKSLKKFLFDPENREQLPWKKRRNIIDGICRGLLYLHRDSRLKIIHRDLTASNVLLDEHLNPKISDFGTARIFWENEGHANTRNVVGTFGYMSPEYAMGQFSEKSDVYSFGVLLLEIVSGRSNTDFNPTVDSCTFLGHIWRLWNEEEIDALIDEGILEDEFLEEILRCIHVGLLCVQKHPRDRPNISTLLNMLDAKLLLQFPEKPPFTDWETCSDE